MIRIKKNDYSNLKRLFIEDKKAIKYRFPVTVISENTDDTLNIHMIEEPSEYLLEKQPWLVQALRDDLLNGKQHRRSRDVKKRFENVKIIDSGLICDNTQCDWGDDTIKDYGRLVEGKWGGG